MSLVGTASVSAPVPVAPPADDQRLARAVLAKGSKSFALAGKLLPRGLRDDAAVVYAWCRRADDAIDLAPAGDATRALEGLRRELDGIYAGVRQDDPVLRAFQEVARRRSIPRAYPAALLDGFAMDAGDTVYGDERRLALYCYRVAGVVGLMMCHVLGVADPRGDGGPLVHAAHLGMAMQLTNICRDVAEDWALGRRYVPASLLGSAPKPIVGTRPPAALGGAFAGAARTMLARADRLYASGARGFTALPWRVSIAIRTAALVYRDIGRVIAARGHDVLVGRAVVSTPRKLLLALRALVGALGELPVRWLRPRRFLPPSRTLAFEELPS